MEFLPTDKIAILGNSGCGKTTLCKKLHESGLWKRVVVFDRMREYETEGFSASVGGFNQFCDWILKNNGQESFRILFRFDLESDGKNEEFNEALRVIFYARNILTVIEETWNYSSKSHIPKWYQELCLAGRHHGLGLISTSQRPASVHNVVLSQSAHIFCGHTFLPNDKKYIADFIGDENAERLPKLNKGDFLHYHAGTVDIVKNL